MKIDLTLVKLNFKDSTGVIKSLEMTSSCYVGFGIWLCSCRLSSITETTPAKKYTQSMIVTNIYAAI